MLNKIFNRADLNLKLMSKVFFVLSIVLGVFFLLKGFVIISSVAGYFNGYTFSELYSMSLEEIIHLEGRFIPEAGEKIISVITGQSNITSGWYLLVGSVMAFPLYGFADLITSNKEIRNELQSMNSLNMTSSKSKDEDDVLTTF